MTERLEQFHPHASEALRLAAQCQHIRRWEIPPQPIPMTRAGYHEWRNGLAKFHASESASLLQQAGYDETMIHQVPIPPEKRKPQIQPRHAGLGRRDLPGLPRAFFAEFVKKHAEEKVLKIIQRT